MKLVDLHLSSLERRLLKVSFSWRAVQENIVPRGCLKHVQMSSRPISYLCLLSLLLGGLQCHEGVRIVLKIGFAVLFVCFPSSCIPCLVETDRESALLCTPGVGTCRLRPLYEDTVC